MLFDKTIKALKQIDVSEISLQGLKRKKEEAFDLNTDDQLFSKGIDSEGKSLGTYAPLTIKLRSEAGLPVDRITTRVTGDFHDAWEGNFTKWPVPFTSSDSKTPDLIFLFGVSIFGLTDDNIDVLLDDGLRDEITESVEKNISKALQLV